MDCAAPDLVPPFLLDLRGDCSLDCGLDLDFSLWTAQHSICFDASVSAGCLAGDSDAVFGPEVTFFRWKRGLVDGFGLQALDFRRMSTEFQFPRFPDPRRIWLDPAVFLLSDRGLGVDFDSFPVFLLSDRVWASSDGDGVSIPGDFRTLGEFDGVFHLGVCLVLGRQRYSGLAGCAMK